MTNVRQLEPGDELRDIDLKGFGVRRQQASISYFVHTRIRGRLKRLTIGKHGSPWTPDTARREAAKLLLAIKSGENPALERDARRIKATTFDELAAQFLDLHGAKLKPRTREEYARLIRLQLTKSFGGMPIEDITAGSVARAHANWRKTPRAANHALAVLSKMMSWAEEQGLREGKNPCIGVEHYRETKRERFLSDEELSRLGAALSEAQAAGESLWTITLVRMLILTGARLGEMLTLKWDHVDLTRNCLRLPDSKTGAKTVLLSAEASALLASLPRIANNPWVFPGHIHGQHLVNAQKPWRAIRERAGLDDVRLHDLRHSFASVAVEVGGTLPIIGHLLGHSQAQTTARYAHVAPNPAQRVANAVGKRIAEAMKGT